MTSTALVSRVNTRARARAEVIAAASLTRGAAGLAAADYVGRALGAPRSAAVVRACAIGEAAVGLGIVTSGRPVRAVWGRVACDLAELAALAPTLRAGNPQRATAALAFAFVALTAAFHVRTALEGDIEERHEEIV